MHCDKQDATTISTTRHKLIRKGMTIRQEQRKNKQTWYFRKKCDIVLKGHREHHKQGASSLRYFVEAVDPSFEPYSQGKLLSSQQHWNDESKYINIKSNSNQEKWSHSWVPQQYEIVSFRTINLTPHGLELAEAALQKHIIKEPPD